MLDVKNIHTLGDLLDNIARDNAGLNLKEVAKLVGISDKTYYSVRNGVFPKKVFKKIQAYLDKEYGMRIVVSKGSRIEIQPIDISGTAGNVLSGTKAKKIIAQSGLSEDQIGKLLEMNTDLHQENKQLKETISRLKEELSKKKR